MKRPSIESYLKTLSRDPIVLHIGEIWSKQLKIMVMKTENLRGTQDWTQEMEMCSQRYENFTRRQMKSRLRLQSFFLECFHQ